MASLWHKYRNQPLFPDEGTEAYRGWLSGLSKLVEPRFFSSLFASESHALNACVKHPETATLGRTQSQVTTWGLLFKHYKTFRVGTTDQPT